MKNQIKKVLLLVTAIVVLTVCLAFGVCALEESGSLGDNVTYTYDSSTGTVVISGEGEMKDYRHATYYYSPFYESDIKSVVIKDGVTSIGDFAFYYCSNLTSISISSTVTSIGDVAFESCTNLANITIPNSVTSIGYSAFDSCKSLTSITIPASVTSIGDGLFDMCLSLTNITVDENNEYYSNDEYGVLYNKDKTTLIRHPAGNERTEYVVPDSVTAIGSQAFSRCYRLEHIKLSDNLTSLGEDVFLDCISLKSLTIPESVVSADECVTYNCYGLDDLYILNKDLGKEDWSLYAILPYCDPCPDETKISNDDFVELCLSCLIETDEEKQNELRQELLSFCESGDGVPVPYTTVHGYAGSTAETYAKEYGFKFEEIKDTVNLTDEDTKVQVEYESTVFDGEPTLLISESVVDANYVFVSLFSKFAPYDISFELNGEKVQPNGKVTVKIPLPENYNADTTFVYYVDDSGNYTKLDSTYSDGYIIFETDHFSEYVLVDESSKLEQPSTEPDEPTTEPDDEPTTEPEAPADDDCGCACHNNGFMKFIYKIINFFRNIFGKGNCCECF